MPRVIDIEDGRLMKAARRGYRNWISRFNEEFDMQTRLSQISVETLSCLAQGGEDGTFYLFDLIMSLQELGSAFEFHELGSKQKIEVIDRYLFLLDRIRFECMRRLGWLESYPGEDVALVELIRSFDGLAPDLQAKVPRLSKSHPAYGRYRSMNTLDRETLIRKMIPKALKKLADQSTTL
jgi:hypothetical protein